MARAAENERDLWRRAGPAAISALAHSGLILILIVATRGPLRLPTPEQPIPVEFMPAAPAPASLVPATPASPLPASPPPPASAPASSPSLPIAAPPAAAVAEPRVWRHPTLMLSATVKSERALRHLEKATAIEQLCDLEAMMQIARAESGPAPDAVIAYAMQDVESGPSLIVADGAAVHSADGWSRLRFRCRFTEAPRRIVAFEFRLGEAIAREDWISHALPATIPPPESEGARKNDSP